MVSSRLFTTISIVFVVSSICSGQNTECVPKSFGDQNIVCVCNATYCDEIGIVEKLTPGQLSVYTSTKDGQRFNHQTTTFTPNGVRVSSQGAADELTITLDHTVINQTILGFGGAFTDAAGISILSLSPETQQNLLNSYYSPNGIEYSVGRVPIGGCDFSPRLYTYDDDQPDDFNLTHFQLAPEDLEYKIPIIQEALRLTSRPIKLFASPWSAPAWMKTNEELTGKGSLKGTPGGQYYETWADYFVRFLQAYETNGITFWAVTAQNEPMDGNIENFGFNAMGYSAETERIFIEQNLGPRLRDAGYGDVALLIVDDDRLLLPQWAEEILRNDSTARDFVTGIAFHWYVNFMVPSSVLTRTHELFPNFLLLASEACAAGIVSHVVLGDWGNAERYANDIIDDLLHWTVGWVDWNIALNMSGGPNWTGSGDDSPIIVDQSIDVFYKQPMFYALGHFSKFVAPGSQVIELSTSADDPDVKVVAFDNPDDDSTIVVILNTADIEKTLTIVDPVAGTATQVVPARAIQTYIWWN